jgi:hypothetical protein
MKAILKPFNRTKYQLTRSTHRNPPRVYLQKGKLDMNKEEGYALPYLTNEPNYFFYGKENEFIL